MIWRDAVRAPPTFQWHMFVSRQFFRLEGIIVFVFH